MKKLFLIIIFISHIELSHAEWIRFFDTYEPVTQIFYDLGTIKTGRISSAWELTNLETGESLIALKEVDCKNRKVRTLKSVWYSEYFGKGKAWATSDRKTNWDHIVPGSTAEAFLDVLCVKS